MNRIAFNKTAVLGAIGGALLLMAACTSDPNAPGVEYMPDMYRSPSHETYAQYAMPDSAAEGGWTIYNTARQPVEGTVPRGWYMPFPYEDNEDDRKKAAVEVTSPFTAAEKMAYLEEGKVAYDKFCTHCHGAKGQADGLVVKKGNHSPPPAYDSDQLKDITEGQIYTAIMLGKGAMGSHASQIEEPDRWKIVAYVQTLQGKSLDGSAEEPAAAEGEEGAEGETDEASEEGADETASNN